MDANAPARPRRPPELRVIKKITPDQRGAKTLAAQYGEPLVCVRHRIDATGTQRLTTVELIVSRQAIRAKSSPLVEVQVKYQERELRQQLMAAGARWDPARRTWHIRRATANALGLKQRILQPAT